MLLDCILLCLVIAFAWIGARRGALTTGTRVVALLLAYGGAIASAQQLAAPLARRLAIAEFFAAPAAAIFGFIVTFCLASLLGALLRGWDTARFRGRSRGALDRAIGGLFGGLRGGLVVLLLCWLAIGFDAARDLAVIEGIGLLPQTEDSRLAHATRSVVAAVVERALIQNAETPQPGARVIAQLLSSPGSALAGLRDLFADPKMAELARDRLFWTLIEDGAAARAVRRHAFGEVSRDDRLRAGLAALGVVSDQARSEIDVFRAEARELFDAAAPKLKALREDPALQQLTGNREIMSLLERGNPLALLQRPEIQSLVDRVLNP